MSIHPDSPASRLARILPVDGTQGAGLGDVIFSALRQALRDGTFQPGDRLREEEIAEHFSVSRTPVRDALRRMSERRLLEISGGRGMMIRRLTRAEVFELYEMREIMEGTAARFAAKNASSTEITLLTDLQAAFETADTPQEWARINKQFHGTIAGAVRNRFFHSPLEELQDFLALLGSTTFSVAGRAEPAADEHRRILEAIAARDPDAAEAAARDHIRSALVSRLKMLNDAG
ncbi:GntR family transcriptional regulator [Allorhizobium borbori]|jgi:DNA-binding GntR family transcriptional regulator|uniref:DNA-binding GntR family transcriptional regulator n=1 Tax=Allorhizobium borbori TaxID=485907 RepID=A0A7W6K5E4_9HYPH|nr:GntR family transcriptional regulator [Allorhizobium borbori]MBB4104465.1 DNA-binding GntR family transcriptional regulator [Allorhizobium borbori]PZU25443.1 MAG: GntR family transcriptional regulator [Shinella sp.]